MQLSLSRARLPAYVPRQDSSPQAPRNASFRSSALRFEGRKTRQELKALRAQNGWPEAPWYKKLWRYRYKLALLPLLGLPLQEISPKLEAEAGPVLTMPFVATSELMMPVIQAKNPNISEAYLYDSNFETMEYVISVALLLSLGMVSEEIVIRCGGTRKNLKTLIAYHELGHLLTALGHQDYFRPPILIKVEENSGFVKPDTEKLSAEWKNLSALERFAKLISKEGLIEIRQLMLETKGGEAMDNLVHGWSTAGNVQDKFNSALLTNLGWNFSLLTANPKEVISFVRFWSERDRRVEEYLVQFDRKMIDELAERLVQDGEWDAAKIRQITAEYGLDRFELTVD